jgi:hypothetical protein
MAFLLSRIGLVRPRSEMIKIKSNQIKHCRTPWPEQAAALQAGIRYGALTEITWLAALHDITFPAHWIPTSHNSAAPHIISPANWIPTADNLLADLLSRRQFPKIAELCPVPSGPQPKK